jgi:cytochrome oxidase Cu insertion factor (SCO1/SenC/PrrC family)
MKWKDLLRVMSVAVLCASFSAAPAHSAEVKKDKAPSFSFRSFDGKEIKLSHFKGKPILLKFISSW